MHEHVTLLPPRPEPRSPDERGISSGVPRDLQAQVRSRVRLLAFLLFLSFSIDPLLYVAGWVFGAVSGLPVTLSGVGFRFVDVVAALASALLWWVSRKDSFPATRLHALGLLYEVTICFVISLTTFWQYYGDHGILPNLTWVPALIVLFPLILPGPPRLMLAAAIAAGAMPLVALSILQATGKVVVNLGSYVDLTISSGIAVAFAYMGARVVYGLGKQVAAARELGSYRLEQRLGQGGMGEVWRARHRMLARPAAIKLIRRSLQTNSRPGVSLEAARRFENEAQVIARLRSPHTVELFDFGIADDGTFYYVMELLEGLDADNLVRRFGPIPAERAVHLLRQVCHSLSEAESAGLVHRDIKPANIFLCRYGEDVDFVKVLDFGLVKALDGTTDGSPALTRENAVQGTPAFIAPEQALGESALDSRVDIYATGCVAYWLLTGQLVFNAGTPMGYVVQHAQSPPTPPSTRTPMSIPPGLDRLVLSCLSKDPRDRPQTARELSRRLGEVEGLDQWTEDRARAWWAGHQQ